jgi:hypothetical protein
MPERSLGGESMRRETMVINASDAATLEKPGGFALKSLIASGMSLGDACRTLNDQGIELDPSDPNVRGPVSEWWSSAKQRSNAPLIEAFHGRIPLHADDITNDIVAGIRSCYGNKKQDGSVSLTLSGLGGKGHFALERPDLAAAVFHALGGVKVKMQKNHGLFVVGSDNVASEERRRQTGSARSEWGRDVTMVPDLTVNGSVTFQGLNLHGGISAGFKAMKGLTIEDCCGFTEVPPFACRVTGDLIIDGCPDLSSLPEEIHGSRVKLANLPKIAQLASKIEFGMEVRVENMPELVSIRGRFAGRHGQAFAYVHNCQKLEALPKGIACGTLDIRNCPSFRSLPSKLKAHILKVHVCDSWDGVIPDDAEVDTVFTNSFPRGIPVDEYRKARSGMDRPEGFLAAMSSQSPTICGMNECLERFGREAVLSAMETMAQEDPSVRGEYYARTLTLFVFAGHENDLDRSIACAKASGMTAHDVMLTEGMGEAARGAVASALFGWDEAADAIRKCLR